MLQRGTTRNGVFGAKMMWNYFDDFRARDRASCPGLERLTFTEALDEVFPKLRIIFVRRRDKVAQAVSLWKAIQTQQWRNEAERRGATQREADYDYDALKLPRRASCTAGTRAGRTGSTPPAASRSASSTRSSSKSRAATVGRVLDELGIDPPEPDGEQGPMKRQADDLSRDWVARFRRRRRDGSVASLIATLGSWPRVTCRHRRRGRHRVGSGRTARRARRDATRGCRRW